MSDADDLSVASSSSSSDDEEYLVSSTNEDRESMIRRKLLQSFYGANNSTDDGDVAVNDSSDTFEGNLTNGDDQYKKDAPSGPGFDVSHSNASNPGMKLSSSHDKKTNADDLDSTNFNPSLYTENLIHTSSTHSLLSSTNNLSSSIRLLDSTMQTLVYENYSKFISATDAIRSIGQSVDLSNEGLDKLNARMERMEVNTTLLEKELSQKRKQVVEKLKLKRLLARLTRLVELPSTLKDLKKNSKYRLLMREYIDAMAILTQHTHGFESLKNIEIECNSIVEDMINNEVGLKMWVWCGGTSATRRRRRGILLGNSGMMDRFWLSGGQFLASGAGSTGPGAMDILPPKDTREIYECAGALLLYAKNRQSHRSKDPVVQGKKDYEQEDNEIKDNILEILTEEECRAMALEGCSRFLESLLDDHLIDVQDSTSNSDKGDQSPTSLYPVKFLNSLLEATTIYGVTFNGKSFKNNAEDQKSAEILSRYVTTWGSNFFAHVRGVLLQHALESDHQEYKQEEEDDERFASISSELMKLVTSVRDIASSLALPEVGLDMEVASGLVEEAVGITESLVRRRVKRKFRLLRVRVIEDCISPFISSVMEDATMANKETIIRTAQLANSALSDGMQFADDTIQSILANGVNEKAPGATLDLEMLKLAVSKNARKFAFWLAASLEAISGCDMADDHVLLDVKRMLKPDDEGDHELDKLVIEAASVLTSDKSDDEEIEADRKEHKLVNSLREHIEDFASDAASDVLNIALVEMCRLAERNVSNNMNQSMVSNIPKSGYRTDKQEQINVDVDAMISIRFKIAASRSLSIYASAKGHEASSTACYDIFESCSLKSEFFPHGPSDSALKVLEIAKGVCINCSAVFGGNEMASSLPDFNDDYRQDMSMNGASRLASGNHGAMKGLSLDVARMFTEKVEIYPHPLDIAIFTRDHVISFMMRVAFRAWLEQIRQCTFAPFAYRQMQVDVEFLKYLLPHYVNEDSADTLHSVLTDLLLNVGERCTDPECVGISEFHDEAMGKVLSPLSIALNYLNEEESAGRHGALDQFVLRNTQETNEEAEI